MNAQGRAITASPNGSRVYVGADFTTVDGNARQHEASFTTATNALDASFRPNVNGPVKALAATNSTAYIGGIYSSVNGSARRNLSAVSPSSSGGSLLSWAPRADYGTASGAVEAMVMAPDQSRGPVPGAVDDHRQQHLHVMGGEFPKVNGVAQQGLVRMAWDYDNELLTDELYRDAVSPPIYATKVKTNFWTVPSANFTDNGLASGTSHSYQVKITDPVR